MLEPEAGLDGAAFHQVRSILRHHHGVLLAPGGIHGLNKPRQEVFALHTGTSFVIASVARQSMPLARQHGSPRPAASR